MLSRKTVGKWGRLGVEFCFRLQQVEVGKSPCTHSGLVLQLTSRPHQSVGDSILIWIVIVARKWSNPLEWSHLKFGCAAASFVTMQPKHSISCQTTSFSGVSCHYWGWHDKCLPLCTSYFSTSLGHRSAIVIGFNETCHMFVHLSCVCFLLLHVSPISECVAWMMMLV